MMMKLRDIIRKIITFVVILSASVFASNSQNASDEATKAFQEGEFAKSTEILENELKIQKEKGLESSELYYNLGNSYFRDNEIAKAILNYERAILINPGDRDTRHNLEFAYTKIEDKIIAVDAFFLQTWFESIQNLQSSNAWAKLSVVLFLLLIASLTFFFFTHRMLIKKVTFYAGIALVVFSIFTNIFSYKQKDKIINRKSAIIMAGSVPIFNSPDTNSKELFTLHSGTKVRVNKIDGNWLEIEIGNGNVGWINSDKLEII